MGVASPTQEEELYLHVVMDFIPETVYRVMKHYNRMKQPVPILLVKLYTYQMFRSLAYIHAKGICHRDIKPQNLLVDPSIHVLKLCDFGSAKKLVKGEPNVSYICSRYYRAPELIFGATDYTPSIDIWSTGRPPPLTLPQAAWSPSSCWANPFSRARTESTSSSKSSKSSAPPPRNKSKP